MYINLEYLLKNSKPVDAWILSYEKKETANRIMPKIPRVSKILFARKNTKKSKPKESKQEERQI